MSEAERSRRDASPHPAGGHGPDVQDGGDPAVRGGLLHAIKAIGWAFFGVRGRAGYDRDVNQLKPLHVIIVGLALALLFVFTLIGVAKLAAS